MSGSAFRIKQDPGSIGKMAAIVHEGKCYVATVIDEFSKTHQPKRVRVIYDPFLQGKVLMPSQYQIKEMVDAY